MSNLIHDMLNALQGHTTQGGSIKFIPLQLSTCSKASRVQEALQFSLHPTESVIDRHIDVPAFLSQEGLLPLYYLLDKATRVYLCFIVYRSLQKSQSGRKQQSIRNVSGAQPAHLARGQAYGTTHRPAQGAISPAAPLKQGFPSCVCHEP